MHKAQRRNANKAKSALPTNTKQQKAKKQVAKKVAKRAFGTGAPTGDPRFSTINADLDRYAQVRHLPIARLAKFDNGMRLATEDAPNSGLTTVALTISSGSRNEDDTNNGVATVVANALRHGVNGNKKQFVGALEDMGGFLKTKVGRERTVISATVQNKYTEDAVKLLAQVFQKPKLSADVVDVERAAALARLDDDQNDIETAVDDRFHLTSYRYSPLSLSPRGHVHTLTALTAEQAQQFHNSNYTAENTVMSIVGAGLDHLKIADLVNAEFSHLPSKPTNGIKQSWLPSNFIASDHRLRDDDMPQVHFSFGFETLGANASENYTLQALAHVIGSYNYQNAALDVYHSNPVISYIAVNSYANHFAPFMATYMETGHFGIHAVAPPNKLDRLGEAMLKTLVESCTTVPEQTLIEAKSKMKAQIFANYTTEGQAEELGRQLIQYKRPIHISEQFARIDDVDQNAVQNVAKRFFHDADFSIAAMGNTFELQDYAVLRKKTVVPYM